MKATLRSIVARFAHFLYRLLTRLEVTGVENIPPSGGCIVALNHLSRLDPPLVYVSLQSRRDKMTALVADKYKRYPLIKPIVAIFEGIWINREEADLPAIRQARDYLRQGGLLGIAPEGTRSRTGGLIEAKTGIAYLADKAEVPIIPAAVSGTEKAFTELLHFRRPHVKLTFGEAFNLPSVDRHNRDDSLKRNTDEIMCRIAAMLPLSYRGVYTNHPRLQELLSGEIQGTTPAPGSVTSFSTEKRRSGNSRVDSPI